MKTQQAYVVCVHTQFQDGGDSWEKVCLSLDAAIQYINDRSDPWGAINTFRLFKLGAEVPLTSGTEIIPEPPTIPKSRTVYSIKPK